MISSPSIWMHHSLTSTLEHLSSFQLFVIILGHWFLTKSLIISVSWIPKNRLTEWKGMIFFFFQSRGIDCQSPSRNPVPIYTSTAVYVSTLCTEPRALLTSPAGARTHSPTLDQKWIYRTTTLRAGRKKWLLLCKNIFSRFLREESRIGRY